MDLPEDLRAVQERLRFERRPVFSGQAGMTREVDQIVFAREHNPWFAVYSLPTHP